MTFRTEEPGEGSLVVIFQKEVLTEDSGELKRLIADQPAVRLLVIDLSAVTLITTPGLGALVALQKYCNEQGKKLVLAGLSPYVNEILDLTRLSRVFEVKATREEALDCR